VVVAVALILEITVQEELAVVQQVEVHQRLLLLILAVAEAVQVATIKTEVTAAQEL
jgi:hypothetical protein